MDPISGSCSAQQTYGVLTTRKALDLAKEQGAEALTLLDSAKKAGPTASSGSVGRLIDVKA